MAENVLEKIINIKSEKILELKKSISLESLEELIKKNSTYVDFKDTIKKNVENKKFSIIAEIKKASPSAGIIIKDYDPIKIANIYKSNKATCLSVLTEEDFFLGNLHHISKIKKNVNLPILCKDFFLDKFMTMNYVQNEEYFNIRYQTKPLMLWIWISVILISLGGLTSLLKKKYEN